MKDAHAILSYVSKFCQDTNMGEDIVKKANYTNNRKIKFRAEQ